MSQTTKPSAIVLDIEGTITPISFVTDTLFPYAREHLEHHLQETYESDETQADIALLQDEVRALVDAPIGLYWKLQSINMAKRKKNEHNAVNEYPQLCQDFDLLACNDYLRRQAYVKLLNIAVHGRDLTYRT